MVGSRVKRPDVNLLRVNIIKNGLPRCAHTGRTVDRANLDAAKQFNP